MVNKKILVIDDDPTFCLMLQKFLSKNQYEVTTAGNGAKALQLMDAQSFDLILTDYRLPDTDGILLLEAVQKSNSHIPVILMTSYGDIKLSVMAIKKGALDYITKPINPQELLELVKNAFEKNEPIPTEKTQPALVYQSEFVSGVSPVWKKIQEHIELIAPTNLSVIIEGDSGTGKEFIARKIHELSNRSTKKFVAIDCGTLTGEIVNSELFGHVKGAFTGALTDKKGQFELADGGTIFLDEIGNLGYETQVKLLRVLQERVIRKIGGEGEIKIDVRLIVATNENLTAAIAKGLFREDLYHRLNEFKITVNRLSQRKEDIPVFAQSFLNQANVELGKNAISFDKQVIHQFLNYTWPGNLRELKNVVRKSVLLSKTEVITIDNIPSEIVHHIPESTENIHTQDLKELSRNIEKETIVQVLQETKNNKSKAALKLNIDRKTLYNKLKEYGLE